MKQSSAAWLTAAGVVAGGLAPLLLLVAVDVPSSAASACPTIRISGPTGNGLTVTSTTAQAGQCVAYVNAASLSVTVTVNGKSLSIASGKSADMGAPVTPSSYRVEARHETLGVTTASGHGTLTVTSAPSSSSPTATHSPSSQPTATRSGKATPTTGPDVAPSPHKHGHRKHRRHHGGAAAGPSPTVSLPPLPPLSTVSPTSAPGANPLVAPGLLSASTDPPGLFGSVSPSPGSSSASPHAAAVEHDSGPSRGLPAAIDVVVILGVAFGLFRVLRHWSARR